MNHKWHETFIVAKKMGINKMAAMNMRVRYLLEQIEFYERFNCDLSNAYIIEYLDEVIYLLHYGRFELIAPATKERPLTEEDIEVAKNYPVDRLIDFKRGKAKCISGTHDDKNPSMFHGTRKNLAVCPACNSVWSPIDIVMKQNGLGWHDAVRSLVH